MVPFLIAGKDLRQRLRDRSAILIALVIPLALAAIFSFALSDVADEQVTFHYALVDQDRGDAERAFVQSALRPLERNGTIELRRVDSVEEGRRLVDDGTVASAFVVPHGFSAAVADGQPTSLQVIGDVDAPIGTLVARSIAEAYANELASVSAAVTAVLSAPGGSKRSPAELARAAAEIEAPIRIDDVSAKRKELKPTTFYAAGMAVFFLFFTVQFGVSTIVDERRDGTLARMMAAPIRRASILGGKVLTSLVLGIASMVTLAVATSLLLGAHWGSPVGVGVLIVGGVLAATAVTALAATLAKTPEQAGYWQSIIALVLGMLGGSFFPVAQAGGLIEKLSLFTPHAWFLRGLTEMSGGGGPGNALPALGALLLFTAVTGSAAVLRLGKLARP
jgi:linearmycin/streptolysin S transport system permease protein